MMKIMILDLCYCHNCLYFVNSNFQFTSLLRKRIVSINCPTQHNFQGQY